MTRFACLEIYHCLVTIGLIDSFRTFNNLFVIKAQITYFFVFIKRSVKISVRLFEFLLKIYIYYNYCHLQKHAISFQVNAKHQFHVWQTFQILLVNLNPFNSHRCRSRLTHDERNFVWNIPSNQVDIADVAFLVSVSLGRGFGTGPSRFVLDLISS